MSSPAGVLASPPTRVAPGRRAQSAPRSRDAAPVPSFAGGLLPDVMRAVVFAVVWALLWSFFLLGVARPGAELHAHGAPAAAVASAELAEGGRP